jgi:hypothetical protein
MTDPWRNRISKMNPAEYARYLLERGSNDAVAAATRIHMEGSGTFLEKADACRAYLLNGSTALTARQIDMVLEVLVLPDPNSPLDPLETEADRLQRGIHIRGLRAELTTARQGR